MFTSYFLYIVTVIFAVLFAYLAQKYKRKSRTGYVPQPFYYGLSMLTLFSIMGFRDISIGVDGYNYLNGFNKVNNVSLFQYYTSSVTEPGFYLLYRIADFLGDFQWVFILSAFITLYFFYKAISYEINNISLPFAIFIFATTQYFYYFGILRMGIAVSIIAFAYRYIIEGNRKKFILLVVLATMFHYSALFALIFLFFGKTNHNFLKRKNLVKIIIIIPLSFFSIKYLIFPFITADRYQGYIESSEVISTGFISSLPLGAIFLIYYIRGCKENENYQFYFLLFVTKIVTEIFAPVIGIGRMVWYVNLSIVFLFPFILKSSRDKGIKTILLLITIIYCLVYSYSAYFGESFRGEHMLPYKIFLNSDTDL